MLVVARRRPRLSHLRQEHIARVPPEVLKAVRCQRCVDRRARDRAMAEPTSGRSLKLGRLALGEQVTWRSPGLARRSFLQLPAWGRTVVPTTWPPPRRFQWRAGQAPIW